MVVVEPKTKGQQREKGRERKGERRRGREDEQQRRKQRERQRRTRRGRRGKPWPSAFLQNEERTKKESVIVLEKKGGEKERCEGRGKDGWGRSLRIKFVQHCEVESPTAQDFQCK